MRYRSLFIVSALFHLFVALRLVGGLAGHTMAQTLLTCVLLASALLVPLGLTGTRRFRQPLADRLSWLALLLMGYFSSLLVLTLLRDVLLIGWWASGLVWKDRPVLGDVSGRTVWLPLLGALAFSVIGFWNARRVPGVVTVEVPLRGLPRALQGFTLVQISDLHVGPTIKRAFVQRIVDRVNRLDGDLIAVTGDLVDGSVAELAAHVAPLAGLRSRHGTFFVTGNHEYYAGAHGWIAELRRIGMTVLLNEHVVLHHGSSPPGARHAGDPQDDSQIMAALVLAGVTDFNAHHFDPRAPDRPAPGLGWSAASCAHARAAGAPAPQCAGGGRGGL